MIQWKDCPNCGSPDAPGATICLTCGHAYPPWPTRRPLRPAAMVLLSCAAGALASAVVVFATVNLLTAHQGPPGEATSVYTAQGTPTPRPPSGETQDTSPSSEFPRSPSAPNGGTRSPEPRRPPPEAPGLLEPPVRPVPSPAPRLLPPQAMGDRDLMDLSQWLVSAAPWELTDSTLSNTRGRETDWIKSKLTRAGDDFAFEMRVRVRSGQRLRVFFEEGRGRFYLGNEGFTHQFEIYGDNLEAISAVADHSYQLGQWYDLRVEVGADNHVALYKDGVLTHTGRRKQRRPLQLVISPGDGYSEGIIDIAEMRLQSLSAR